MSTTNSLLIVGFISFLLLVQASAVDYGVALTKSLLYFEAQRSGKLPANQRVTWRGDSGLHDGKDVGVDLTGGYYDSGDNVKFGFPLAFTLTMLAWSVVDFGKYLSANNELNNALDALKWGTDYLIKASSSDGIFYGQVGDGHSDHDCWQRPEDMHTPRTTYQIDVENFGSDLAGESAAALAAASIAFNESDPIYAYELLDHAIKLRDFAHDFPGIYSYSIPEVQDFYKSNDYTDELIWADAWLYRATNYDEKYLKIIQQANRGWQSEFSWNQKDIGARILVTRLVLQGKLDDTVQPWINYLAYSQEYICDVSQRGPNNFPLTDSGGLLYFQEWNNLQYTTAALFLVMVYAEYLTTYGTNMICGNTEVTPGDLYNFVQPQVDYILGNNPMNMSYMVGFGTNYPQRVHHRASSIVSLKKDRRHVTCKGGYVHWYHKPDPNPNVLDGAVVGGPNQHDRYLDTRINVKQTEPSTTTVAPLVGVLARLSN
ncbi:hypothetical protein MKX03_026692 [Papaver bracteatum]|nr:hypothetical protein MKX03_026692 [Papaver bracteatum]